MIPISMNKRLQVPLGVLPRGRIVQLRPAIAGPHGCFIEYQNVHLIRDIEIKRRIRLRMQPDSVQPAFAAAQ